MSWMNVGAELVAQEPVHLAAVVAVGGVDRGQHVPLHAVPLEHLEPAITRSKVGLPPLSTR